MLAGRVEQAVFRAHLTSLVLVPPAQRAPAPAKNAPAWLSQIGGAGIPGWSCEDRLLGRYGASTTTDQNQHDVLHLSRTVASLTGFGSPVRIVTSADLKQRDLQGLTAGARAKHTQRAQLGGAAKGRLLYVASGQTVLAYLGVHVPPKPGPIICEAFAAVEAATDRQYALMQSYLLEAAEELSVEALKRSGEVGQIAWATDDHEFRKALAELGFQTAAKPVHSDCNRAHYVEATFT